MKLTGPIDFESIEWQPTSTLHWTPDNDTMSLGRVKGKGEPGYQILFNLITFRQLDGLWSIDVWLSMWIPIDGGTWTTSERTHWPVSPAFPTIESLDEYRSWRRGFDPENLDEFGDRPEPPGDGIGRLDISKIRTDIYARLKEMTT